ncbi:hypothetical protein MNV49_007708 [Pseudohyphozyma bogoriensis]|nr:hypothetical protein MNV49_007708 [Pseudohyphozyma bogoriensis]
MTALPPPRRVVTGFDDETGLGKVAYDEPVKMNPIPGGPNSAAIVWATEELLADVQTKKDGSLLKLPGIVNPNGSVMKYIDLAPSSSLNLHYTTSIDYGVVLTGEATLELDDGSMTVMKAGDSLVENGTVHAWHNKTTEWTRLLFVLLPAKPVLIDGKPLQGHHRA